MATLTLTLTSAAVAGSPLTRTITFNDADLPNILAAYRNLTNNPAMTGGDVLAFLQNGMASHIQRTTAAYLGSQAAVSPNVTQT